MPSGPPRERRVRISRNRQGQLQAPPELGLMRRTAANPTPPLDSQQFLHALEFAMRHEQVGGPDQATNYGLTRGFLNDHEREHRGNTDPYHVSPDEARRLYYALWNRIGAQGLTERDALARFDTALLHGENDHLVPLDRDAQLAGRQAEYERDPLYGPGHLARLRDLQRELDSTR